MPHSPRYVSIPQGKCRKPCARSEGDEGSDNTDLEGRSTGCAQAQTLLPCQVVEILVGDILRTADTRSTAAVTLLLAASPGLTVQLLPPGLPR